MKPGLLASLLCALALAGGLAAAQEAPPELRVRASIQDADPITPGATVALQLDVLTPTDVYKRQVHPWRRASSSALSRRPILESRS